MDDRVYWIWLQQALKYGSNKIRTVNLIYEGAEDFYNAGPDAWKMCGCFTPKEINFMKSYKIDKAYAILDRCKQLGQEVVTLSDERYPERLKQIANPPCVLYVKGELPETDNKICIAMVGTRSATLYGIQMAFDISMELANAGVVVVSGGALGVDTSSHKGAIQGGGRTIAVLGCGIDYGYLMQNASLRDVICKNGALVSEFAPNFPAYPSNFPMRNRIISGLSLGTVVIEAGRKSGSLITAGLALEQNRDVFAVPVDMNSSVSEGTTALIRDGAKIVTCGEDILCEYRATYFREREPEKSEAQIIFKRPTEEDYKRELSELDASEKGIFKNEIMTFGEYLKKERDRKEKREEKRKEEKSKEKKIKETAIKTEVEYDINKLSLEEQSVYNVLKSGAKHVDALTVETKLPIRKLLPILTDMELSGIVESYAGKMYGLKKNKEDKEKGKK